MTEQPNDWKTKGLLVLLFVILGFFLQQMWMKQERNSRRITQLEIDMAAKYVPKEDFKERVIRLEDKLNFAPRGGYK